MASDATSTAKSSARATERKAAATKRSTSAKKAATTRAKKTTGASAKRTTTRAKRTTASAARTAEARTQATTREAKTGFDLVGDVAERAVLTGVGAALTARDNVRDLRVSYSSRAEVERRLRKAQRELETDLRRYERRGTTARNQLEREVKKVTTRVERELRQRREGLTKVVSVDVPAPESVARNAKAQIDLTQARVGNAVETAQLAGAQVVAKVTERVAALV